MKTMQLAVVLLPATALGCGVAAASLDGYVRAAANRLIAAPGVTLAGIRPDLLRGRLLLTGLSAGRGDRRITVGTLDLPLHRASEKSGDVGAQLQVPPAAPSTPAPAARVPAADFATADDIVVTSGPSTIRIKHIEIAGSSLSSADVAALFDAKNPGAENPGAKDPKVLEARLRKLDAASIVIPEITVDSINGTKETHVAQKQVLLAGVRSGRAATGSAGTATMAFKNGTTDAELSIGAATFKGLDLAQIAHLAAGPRSDDAEALRPICDEIAIQAVTIGGAVKDGQPVTIATIREAGLKGRPLGTGFGDTADGGKEAAAALKDIAHSFSADLIEAHDVGLAGRAASATDGLRSLALEHVAVRGLGDGKLARFEMSGLAVEGNEKQPGKLALASAEIDDVATDATPVPSVDRIDLRDLAVDIPTDDKARSGQRIALAVAHAGYEAPGLVVGKLPQRATLSIEHAAFDVPPDNGAAPVLLAMGYKRLDLSSESISRYDAAGQTLDLDRLALVGVGMGALDIKLGLAKVSEGIVSQNDAVQKAAAAAVLVKTLELTLRNDGLIDKAIGFKAAIDGVTLDQERTNIAQLVDTGLVGFGLQASAKAQRVVAALHKFIAEPKTLHIALASKNGLGADAIPLIDSPQALLDALEVEAGADE